MSERTPIDDAALSATLVRGMQPVRVTLADHDPRWSARFSERRDELRRVLGERALLIEHVGSTSVPGLAAGSRPMVGDHDRCGPHGSAPTRA